MNNIDALEKRYQALYSDFQAGKIDEATFVTEVDSLQFQDDWGRYWMIGAQTGSWHYYDGQAWHQADPDDADKLPFMDDQGRYWQRGAKSGDWYYYQSDTGEWVKPSRDEGMMPPTPSRQAYNPGIGSYQPQGQLHSATVGPQTPTQSDGELFQDDEGRYWSIGTKTGQWYFYDHEGWHPAHEFQARIASQYQSQPAQLSYQPSYNPQPSQLYTQPGQPGQFYGYPSQQPGQGYVVPPGQPAPQAYVTQPGQQPGSAPPATGAQVVSPPGQGTAPGGDQHSAPAQSQQGAQVAGTASAGEMPKPPKTRTKSGAWYYLDGDRWYKYETDEPVDDITPPDPKKVVEQDAKKEKIKVESKEEAVVAELFEDDEPPPEVVDVEIVTVIEAEPELEPDEEPEPAPELARRATSAYAPPPRREDEIRPRRTAQRTRPIETSASTPDEMERLPRRQRATTPSSREPSRPATPRKREEAHEPTIIIPTDAAASNIASSKTNKPASRPVKPASRPVKPVSEPVRPAGSRSVNVSPEQQRRARENTLPVEPVANQPATRAASKISTNPPGASRGVTQPMPQVVRSGPERVGSGPARAVTAPLELASPAAKTAPAPATRSAAQPELEKEGYTFGDILRSFPSTIWTFVGGMALLLIFAAILLLWIGLRGGGEEVGSGALAAVNSLTTPTLAAAPPNATPTPGPTPTVEPEPIEPPEPAAYTTFSSEGLGFTVDYPEDWILDETNALAIFSPSDDGLEPDNLKDAAFWLGKSDEDNISISDLLADILTNFPADAETLNEGTINIASQPWTSAQIRFEDENLGGQGIATLAVTNKDGVGYSLVAVAPAETWNLMQPMYQEMINSFRFGTKAVAATSSDGVVATTDEGEDATSKSSDSTTPSASAAAPTPVVEATPVVHTIQSGDTLLGIANQYGVDVDLLADENSITDPNSLRLGQELIIPFTAEELAAYNARVGGASSGADSAATAEATEDDSATTEGAESEEEASADSTDATTSSNVSKDTSGEAAPLSGRIAYAAFNPGTNVYDLWMVDVATGEQNVIATEASQPAFNRDGSLLAYRSWGLSSRGIFFRDFVGGRGGQVTRFVEDGLPTWSPDGYSFAFASRREGDRVARLFRGNQEGFDDLAIGFQGEYPSAFPDGKLVVKGCSVTGDCGLYVMGANGGGETKISESGDTAPAVSPDGSKIAFMSSGRGATDWEIWVMNADGSNAQRLTQSRSNEGLPAWSPDGKSIAYASDQGGQWAIWVMNVDGSNQRKLVNMSGSPDGIVLHDSDNSRGWLEERISWAP